MSRRLAIVLACFGLMSASGQERGTDPNGSLPPGMTSTASLREAAGTLMNSMRALGDWNEHYTYLSHSVESVYQRNGWDSEPDQFSLDVMLHVSRFPPWQVQDRLNALTELVGDRYQLNDHQRDALQRIVIREVVDGFREHAPRILQYAPEALQTRASGEAFTPEQISRWSRLATPVFQGMRKRIDSASQEFLQELDPEQRELVKADLAASNRRLDDIEKMSREWMAGRWDPADWGLENDPIQKADDSGAATPDSKAPLDWPRALNPADDPPLAEETVAPDPVSKRPRNGPDDEWAAYVRSFIRRYALDDEQQQRAWLYYDDARKRADIFSRRTLPTTQPATSRATPADRNLDRLFESLKRRLDRLPTRGQRKAADNNASARP